SHSLIHTLSLHDALPILASASMTLASTAVAERITRCRIADIGGCRRVTPSAHSKHSLHLPIGLSHRLGDGNVVSSLHCMNDPQAEGHMASHIGRRKFLATRSQAANGAHDDLFGRFARLRGYAAHDTGYRQRAHGDLRA